MQFRKKQKLSGCKESYTKLNGSFLFDKNEMKIKITGHSFDHSLTLELHNAFKNFEISTLCIERSIFNSCLISTFSKDYFLSLKSLVLSDLNCNATDLLTLLNLLPSTLESIEIIDCSESNSKEENMSILRNFKNLKSLRLQQLNGLGIHWTSFWKAIRDLPSLQELRIHDCEFPYTDAVTILPQEPTRQKKMHFKNINILEVSSCFTDLSDIKRFYNYFSTFENVTELSLSLRTRKYHNNCCADIMELPQFLTKFILKAACKFDMLQFSEYQLRSLTHLSLHSVHLLTKNVQMISQLRSLEHLELFCKEFTIPSENHFQWSCTKLKHLTTDLKCFDMIFGQLNESFPSLESFTLFATSLWSLNSPSTLFSHNCKQNKMSDLNSSRNEDFNQMNSNRIFGKIIHGNLTKLDLVNCDELIHYADEEVLVKTFQHLIHLSFERISSDSLLKILSLQSYPNLKSLIVSELKFSNSFNNSLFEEKLSRLKLESLTLHFSRENSSRGILFKLPYIDSLHELSLKIHKEYTDDITKLLSPSPSLRTLSLLGTSQFVNNFSYFPALTKLVYDQPVSLNTIIRLPIQYPDSLVRICIPCKSSVFFTREYNLLLNFAIKFLKHDISVWCTNTDTYLMIIFQKDLKLRELLFKNDNAQLEQYFEKLFVFDDKCSFVKKLFSLTFSNIDEKFFVNPQQYPFNWNNYSFIFTSDTNQTVFLHEMICNCKSLLYMSLNTFLSDVDIIENYIFGVYSLLTNSLKSKQDYCEYYLYNKFTDFNIDIDPFIFFSTYQNSSTLQSISIINCLHWVFTNEKSPFLTYQFDNSDRRSTISHERSLSECIALFDEFFGFRSVTLLSNLYLNTIPPSKLSLLHQIVQIDLEDIRNTLMQCIPNVEILAEYQISFTLTSNEFVTNESIFNRLKSFFSAKHTFAKCPICYDLYLNQNVEYFTYLENGTVCQCHLFHKKCLQEWLEIQSYCPICKRKYKRKVD